MEQMSAPEQTEQTAAIVYGFVQTIQHPTQVDKQLWGSILAESQPWWRPPLEKKTSVFVDFGFL